MPESTGPIAERHGIEERALADEVERARTTLFERRGGTGSARPIDDKVIAGWNGLAIRALAVAGRALGDAT